MIMQDAVKDLIIAMDLFMTKKGQDLTTRKSLMAAISKLTDEDSLDAIYVNNQDNFNIPDVVVIPLYNKNFNMFLMDGDLSNTCPFGYTIEIHERCFTNYTPEELTAVVMHDIMQNVLSCSAKVRFMKAYNAIMNKYRTDDILSIFDNISNSEVTFMIYMDICTRPFRVPVMQYDYLGTDEVLKTMGLGDAYDSYLSKVFDSSNSWINVDSKNNTPEKRIEVDTKNDYRTVKTVLSACMDKDIRHYYTMVRNGVPLVTLDHIFGNATTVASLGMISRQRNFKSHYQPSNTVSAMSESFMNPKNELEIRFQIDKIISEMRYAESEAEREVILFKIKNLSLKLYKTQARLNKDYERRPDDKKLRTQIETVQNYLDELDALRDKTVKMDIKEKRYGVFVKTPVAYAEDDKSYIQYGINY